MMIRYPLTKSRHRCGYSLVLTLMVLAAITTVVIGFFTRIVSERATASSFEAVDRAEIALDASYHHATSLLVSLTGNDQYLILQQSKHNLTHPKYDKNLLIVATPSDNYEAWDYTPLSSGLKSIQELKGPPNTNNLEFEPSNMDSPIASANFKHTPWDNQPDQIYWHTYDVPTADQKNATHFSARYAFWIEDLQSFVNLQSAGNNNNEQKHHRTSYPDLNTPAHVPGLNLTHPHQPLLNQTALYTLINPKSPDDQSDIELDNWLIESRRTLVTPHLWKSIAMKHGFPHSNLVRDKASKLFPDTHPDYQNAANSLDCNTITGIIGYDELALIPAYLPDQGFVGQGKNKLNLNLLLSQIKEQSITSGQAVEKIASHIRKHLPHFEKRAGGFPFPENGSIEQKQFGYLKALAASIIDYADDDHQPTIKEGEYRGMDAIPLVNEYFVKARLISINPTKTEVTWSLTFFAEIWNMTNHPIEGEIQASFEFNNEVSIYADTYQPSTEDGLSRMIDPKPTLEDDIYWFPPVKLETPITANQHQVIKVGEVTFRHSVIPIGSEDFQIHIDEWVNDRYRLRYRSPKDKSFVLIDRPRGTLQRQDAVLKDGSNTNKTKINSNGVAAQYGYTLSPTSWIANQGDPRASFYLGEPRNISDPQSKNLEFQGGVAYVGGASPGGRNFRKNVTANPPRSYSETSVHLWPDGGHSIEAGQTPNSHLLDPDKVVQKEPGTPPKSPQIITNAGKYYSVTELANIFDPHFWQPSTYQGLKSQLSSFHDLPTGEDSVASPHYCGGNTLRIGRPEHRRWRLDDRENHDPQRPSHRGLSASALLDIFHTGDPTSNDPAKITGSLTRIHSGQMNLNTATKDTLRAVLAGHLVMDPHSYPSKVYPPYVEQQADQIAQAIIDSRPYLTPAEAADKVKHPQHADQPLFGHVVSYHHSDGKPVGTEYEMHDAAVEELFARLYNNSTVRSRNFRIHCVAQILRHTRGGTSNIEASRAKTYHVFIQPERDASGGIVRQKIRTTYVQTP